MADITPVAMDTTLTARTFTTAANGGDKIVQPGGTQRMLLVFKNTANATRTVTIAAQETAPVIGGFGVVTVANKVLILADGSSTSTYGYVEIPKLGFNKPSDGNKILITYSSEAGLGLIAFKLPSRI